MTKTYEWEISSLRLEVEGYLLTVEMHPPTRKWNWGLATKQNAPPYTYSTGKIWINVKTGTCDTREHAKEATIRAFELLHRAGGGVS